MNDSKNSSRTDALSARIFGISRHRMTTDGDGVTTLVGFHGCPLSCAYCLNPQCESGKFREYSVPELYDTLKIDDLYFLATGGGVTFGGGEPLVHSDFIKAFIRYAEERSEWSFMLETSLAVTLDDETLDFFMENVRLFLVDIKDVSPEIYRRYAHGDVSLALANLERMVRRDPSKIIVRLPLIPEYNSPEDVDRSENALRRLGLTRFDRFTYKTGL